MTTHGHLSLSEGVVSTTVAPGAHMDAAVAKGDDSIAAFEIGVGHANVTVGAREDYRAPLTLTVSCDRATMLELGCLLLDRGGAPAFNERQWRMIATALRAVTGTGEVFVMADQIEKAYSLPNPLVIRSGGIVQSRGDKPNQ
jgi:hypothetical protein